MQTRFAFSIPLSGAPLATWSLFNFACAVLGAVSAATLISALAHHIKGWHKRPDATPAPRRKCLSALCTLRTLLLGAAGLIGLACTLLFFLFEDLRATITLVNHYSWLFAGLLLAHLALVLFCHHCLPPKQESFEPDDETHPS